MGWISKLRNRDEGAQLVEFAILAPFLILLLLGIIEFGFFLGEWNEIKHGVHEGARLAAVNDNDLLNNTCATMDVHGSSTVVSVDFTDGGSGVIGDTGTVSITASNIDSLSGLGLIEAFLPDSISADADFRLEQDSGSWDSGSQDGDC